jgi:hypothetical protein
MPLRTCSFSSATGEIWIRDVDYELLARSVEDVLARYPRPVERDVTTLMHRRLTQSDLNDLVSDVAPVGAGALSDAHRASLSARFRAVSVPGHRRLDAWSVERAGTKPAARFVGHPHGTTSTW